MIVNMGLEETMKLLKESEAIVRIGLPVLWTLASLSVFTTGYVLADQLGMIKKIKAKRRMKKGLAPYEDGQLYLEFMKDYI